MRKAYVVMIVVGGILVVGGGGLLYAAVLPSTVAETITIPADGFVYYEMWILGGGTVSGNWSIVGGQQVDFWVLTAGQFATYSETGFAPENIWHGQAQMGTFVLSLPGTGRFYAAFDHGDFGSSEDQKVRVSLSVVGVDLLLFPLGIGLISAGAVLFVVGRWKKPKAEPTAAPPTAPPSDVVIFETPSGRPPP